MKRLQRVLIVPDCHVPYHDEKAFNLMLKVSKDFKPDTIVIQGDFADFYSVSSHSKDPNRTNHLDEELIVVNQALDKIDALGAKNKYFIAGNHENRLERYLQENAPEIYRLMKIPKLFNLKERGWNYTPYKEDVQIGKLNVTHDVGTAGKFAIYNALSTYQHNVTHGHTHRISFAVEGNAKGETHVGATFGWLGDARLVDYMHRVKVARDWALGFGIGYLEPETGHIHLQPIVIVKNKCVVNGKLYKV